MQCYHFRRYKNVLSHDSDQCTLQIPVNDFIDNMIKVLLLLLLSLQWTYDCIFFLFIHISFTNL